MCLRQNAVSILLFILLTLAALSAADAQITRWPPEPSGAAPIMADLELAEHRFLPSTARWNLVWADQLRPYLLTPAKIVFAATHFMGSQKLWKDQSAEFRQHDDNFLMLTYHLAVGLNPARNDDCPDPKSLTGDGRIGVVAPEGYVSEWETHWLPWLQNAGIPTGEARFEDMFQHYDAVSLSNRVWHQDPYWLMNMDNADWRSYVAEVCLAWMTGNENEGCFFDVAVETSAWLYNPKAQNPAPGNFDWWAAPHRPSQRSVFFADRRELAAWTNAQYLGYFQSVYRRFHAASPQYLVIPNVDQMVTSVYDPTWLDGDAAGESVDGVMMEGFGNYRGYDMWLTLDRCVRHVTGRGKILIAQFSDHSAEERYRRTAMYMLVKNANCYINAVAEDVRWYPEYEIDLGTQSAPPQTLEELRVAGSGDAGLWRRDYEGGMVLVNTSNAEIAYALPAERNWSVVRTSGGGIVGEDGIPQPQAIAYDPAPASVRVPASDGLILRSEIPTSVTGSVVRDFSIDVWPQPAAQTLHVSISGVSSRPLRLWLTDVLGRSIVMESPASGLQEGSKPAPASTATLSIPVAGLRTGFYMLSVRFSDGQLLQRRVLVGR
jgi:hypothetical protein